MTTTSEEWSVDFRGQGRRLRSLGAAALVSKQEGSSLAMGGGWEVG